MKWFWIVLVVLGSPPVYGCDFSSMVASVEEGELSNALLRAGEDRSALEQLLPAVGARVFRYLRKKGASHALAEDLAQDVLAILLQKHNTFKDGHSLAWVRTIARNTLNAHRRRKANKQTPESSLPVPLDARGANRGGPDLMGFEAWEVEAAFKELSPQLQDVMREFYFDSKTAQQISDETGVPLGTVLTRLRRGRAKLKDILEARGR